GIADLRVQQILPEVHARAVGALRVRQPRGHLRHAPGVDADAAERPLDELLRGGDPGARLSREEQDPEPEGSWIDALPAGSLGEVEGVGRRPVEGRRTNLPRPLHCRERLALTPGPEGEHRRPQALAADERAPRPHAETEERADQDAIARPDADPPQDSRVSLADPIPVVGAHTEDGGTTRGAAGPVDPRDALGTDAEVVAERRMRALRHAELLLGHHREAPQVQESLQRRRRSARRLPLAPVEDAPLPRVPDLRSELREDQLVPRGSRRAFDLGQPRGGVGRRAIRRVVARRPEGEVHAPIAPDRVEVEGGEGHEAAMGERVLAGVQPARAVSTSSRTRATRAAGGVPRMKPAATPKWGSGGTSSSGITPPATSRTSAASLARRSSTMRGRSVKWAPDRMLTPSTSTSSWTAAATTSSGVR